MDRPRLEDAVVMGVAKGQTAKECSFETGYDPGSLTNKAKSMGLAFKWAKIAKIPEHMEIPTRTVVNRERHTVRMLVRAIELAIRETNLPPSHSAVQILVKALGAARRRANLRT